jgi:hypothetical protein
MIALLQSDTIAVGAYGLFWSLVTGWAIVFTINCCTRESRRLEGIENRRRCDAEVARIIAEQERS